MLVRAFGGAERAPFLTPNTLEERGVRDILRPPSSAFIGDQIIDRDSAAEGYAALCSPRDHRKSKAIAR